MPAGNAYSSGHLVLSLFGLAFVLLLETRDALYRLDIIPVCDITGLTLLNLTFYKKLVSIEYLQRVWHADKGRLSFWTPGSVPFLARLHFSAEELLLYPRRRRQRPCRCRRPRRRPQNVRANVKVLEF